MSIIWVIERPKPAQQSMAHVLMGDFAIRVFASLNSFRTLAQIQARQRKLPSLPQIVAIDSDDFSVSSQLIEMINCQLPATTQVFIGTQRSSSIPVSVEFLSRPFDPLSFSSHLKGILRRKSDQHSWEERLVYKSIVLDTANHSCEIRPDGSNESLPLKEARLLRLFIERAGSCVSRVEIKNIVWGKLAISPRTIDSHVSRLRRRLEQSDVSIESVYGGGYILK